MFERDDDTKQLVWKDSPFLTLLRNGASLVPTGDGDFVMMHPDADLIDKMNPRNRKSDDMITIHYAEADNATWSATCSEHGLITAGGFPATTRHTAELHALTEHDGDAVEYTNMHDIKSALFRTVEG